jgi:2-polyprenyl-3-methyl-5-hydroxy-6-metoxy-1,4-benzoquinol methylase
LDKNLVRDIVQWDVRSWSKALSFWERALARDGVGGRCLELGAREGGLSLWLALKGMEVTCSDVARTESQASPLHKRYGVASQIKYCDIDATDIPFENHFDIVVFKSVLGGVGYDDRLDRQQMAIDQIFKALKPGGRLLFAENLKATRLHAWLRRSHIRGFVNRWRYVTLDEMRSFFKQYATCEMHTAGVLSLLGRSEAQRNLLALLDRCIPDFLVPKTWKYYVYGIAVKPIAVGPLAA